MRKALVAGGAGFIGCHLCERLLKENYIVVCIDNLITGSKENIKSFFNNKNFIFIEYDITQPLSTLNFLPRRQAGQISNLNFIFHLASPASPNKKSPRSYINYPIETLLANSLGTYQLVELANETGASFLFASSSEVYGDPAVSPQDEEYFGNVNPIGIRSVYDEGKRFGETTTMAYVRKMNIDARIVRIFNTYGSKMQKDDGRVISNFINQAIINAPITIYGDGLQTRSFCYIDDMIEGIIQAMFSDAVRGQVVNLGNPDERKITEIADMIKTLSNSSSNIVFEELPEDDPKIRKPDINKAEKLLHWESKITLEEGLRRTIDYFKEI